MKSLANCMSSLKVLVLAGSMILVPAGAIAQQEVSPDIYADSSPTMAQNAKLVQQAKKQSTDSKRLNAAAKDHKGSSKKTDDRKLAAADSGKNITLAQGR